jgi:hypothetical protein
MKDAEHFALLRKLMFFAGCPIEVTKRKKIFPFYAFGIFRSAKWGTLSEANIGIWPTLTNYQKVAVAAHEIGHAICWNKQCRCCWNGDAVLMEVHAWRYSLQHLLDYGNRKSLFFTMEQICSFACGCRSKDHQKACRRLIKCAVWKKCRERYGQDLERFLKNRSKGKQMVDPTPKMIRALWGTV